MANQNFVVHNGLSVGGFVVNATTSNVTLPVTKQLAIGNVILRDNGDGKLHIRDITDNSDAELIGTVGAVSTTSGNIQIGTNHIESTNPNGLISLRPNGNGNIAFSSNTIMIGHGGAFTLIGTGIQTDPFYGVNYPATNIIVTMSAINSSGNLRLSMTTPASSTTTGALQVMGGVGIIEDVYVGGGIGAGGSLGSAGQVLQSTGTGIQWAAADQILGGASNVRVTANYVNVSVQGSNVISAGRSFVLIDNNLTVEGNLRVNGNVTYINANNLSINDSMIYLADDNPADTLDIGLVSAFTSGSAPGYQHTGFVRDASDGIWKLFANVVAEPTTTVDFTFANYSDMKVGNITPGLSNLQSLGSSTLWWQKTWSVAVNAQYADLAENYVADAHYDPGTVLHFGGEYEVSQCNVDHCSRVAGVVSTNPAYLMNATQAGDIIASVALVGRVPTKVTGSIKKGDMLVSAGNGRARAEANPRVGAVIGKALENSEGDAVIEVVVGKH